MEIGEGSKHLDVNSYVVQISNVKSTNIRSIAITIIQNMNLILNMKDINKILAKTHFKCKFLKIVETCLYKAVGSLPVMPSLLPHILCGRSKVSLFFYKCGEHWCLYI